MKPKIVMVVSMILMLGCQKKHEAQLENDGKLMALLQCEARQLKEERFKAANDIRLLEDSLMKYHIAMTTAQSQQIDSIKIALTIRTGKLADKITKKMDSLFATTYKTPQQRDELDAVVEKLLHQNCK